MATEVTPGTVGNGSAGGPVKRLWVLEGGTLNLPGSMVMIGGDGSITVPQPLPSFLIEHERGLVLWDTGLVPEAATDPTGVYPDFAALLEYKPEQTVLAQLDSLGYGPKDIDYVLMSHLHFDHTGALPHFAHAKIYVGRGEIEYARQPQWTNAHAFRVEDIDAIPRKQWLEVEGDHDVFGDGSLQLLWMPGHSVGGMALRVQLPTQSIILAGDSAHVELQLETMMPLEVDADNNAAIRTLYRLRLLREWSNTKLWIPHEINHWNAFVHAPDAIT
jgi:glyoxylase-like metal-dependent hydrolase (beta-lactamase superfamily II)